MSPRRTIARRRGAALLLLCVATTAAIAQSSTAPPPPAPMHGPLPPSPPVRTRVDPLYPHGAHCRNIGGAVRVLLQVDAEGQVTGASVVASSGHRELDRAAVTALRQWRFAASEGAFSGQITVRFEPPGRTGECLAVRLHYGGSAPELAPGTLGIVIDDFPIDADTLDIVLHDPTGAAVERIPQVRAPGRGASWSGRFSGLRPGRYRVAFVAGGRERKAIEVRVDAAGNVTLALPAAPAGER